MRLSPLHEIQQQSHIGIAQIICVLCCRDSLVLHADSEPE